ncbi:amidohydrolase family protein [Leeuwenhoekiella nanhaiensis]|uniref:Amidohydrolase n=1 Tax=Leeuwenhoekiella nanhaiensis TaxID=1655491 RepID=A0A2G1VPI6_9FLAO|nr:amidohydrolase family protein [Leeuwenhoekiella nanhaiensis]PHQ28672.1 amidohydrolase [Leeuwenhoekiella nanhaiensis]
MKSFSLKNVQLRGHEGLVVLKIEDGKVSEIRSNFSVVDNEIDCEGRLLIPGYVESHIHLDKACILDRCTIEKGTLEEAVNEVSTAKADFTEEDVYTRGSRVIEKAIKNGTQVMRSFVEVDPRAGMRSFEALLRLKNDYAFALGLQICAFAQEGLTQEMETYGFLEAALDQGADWVGGCPYKDEDPQKHIDLIFDLGEKYRVPVDFHLDFDLDPDGSSIPYLCKQTQKRNYQGKVSIGHVTKLAAMEEKDFVEMAKKLAEAQIALTVLPATDLFLNGRDSGKLIPRGVANANQLGDHGVLTSLSSNNILNPFTPYGDADLCRMGNLYANVVQLSKQEHLEEVFDMITRNAAEILNVPYEIIEGSPATFVLVDAENRADAIREVVKPLKGWKKGVLTFENPRAEIFKPEA